MIFAHDKKKRVSSPHLGFTIVEMLVTITIFLSILLIVSVNLRVWFQRTKLLIAKDTLVDDLRKMQTYSLTGKICLNTESSVCSSNVPPYGLRFTACSSAPCPYTLFVDSQPYNNTFDSALGEALSFGAKKFPYRAFVDILVQYSGGGYVSVAAVDVVFEPYTANVTVNNLSAIKKVKYIVKNEFGNIEVILDKESGAIIETSVGGEIINANTNGNVN